MDEHSTEIRELKKIIFEKDMIIFQKEKEFQDLKEAVLIAGEKMIALADKYDNIREEMFKKENKTL